MRWSRRRVVVYFPFILRIELYNTAAHGIFQYVYRIALNARDVLNGYNHHVAGKTIAHRKVNRHLALYIVAQLGKICICNEPNHFQFHLVAYPNKNRLVKLLLLTYKGSENIRNRFVQVVYTGNFIQQSLKHVFDAVIDEHATKPTHYEQHH